MAQVELYKEGDLRVWWVRNPPSPEIRIYVKSPEQGISELDRLAEMDLQIDEVWGNAGGLEVYENGEWYEWYNEDGEDINEYADRLAGEL